MKKTFIIRAFLLNITLLMLVIIYNYININTLDYKITNNYEKIISITRHFHHRYLNAEYENYKIGTYPIFGTSNSGVIILKDGTYPKILNDLNDTYNKIIEVLPKDYVKSLSLIMPNAQYVLPFDSVKYDINHNQLDEIIKNENINSSFDTFRDDDITIKKHDKGSVNNQSIILPIYIKRFIEAVFIVDIDISNIDRYVANYNNEMMTHYEVEKNNGLLTQKIEIPYTKDNNKFIYIGLSFFGVLICALKIYIVIECIYQIFNRVFLFFYQRIMYDSMTHCLRRNVFDMKYKTLNSRSVILFDIDHFKFINDNFGHAVGDKVIIAMGKMLQQQAKKHHLYFRWGGEEFLVLLPKTNKQALLSYAETLRVAVEEMPLLKDRKVTISLGVSEQKQQEHIHQTIYRADMALYQAKQLGRNKSHYL
ncbi:GGDEF domain-containing protein [Photobacterium leiognathi]|uniref:GGDEF domain-containing protein n=1 Tax=Photobacterium leiognathi TaxID=553611 RepID=UPI0029810BE7|nr:GGDEF domain-containing protein [Photobacterium leiognathi]